jgi:alpha-mannosidase
MRFVTVEDESDTWGHGVASFGDGTPVSRVVGVSHASGAVLDSAFRQFESGKSEIDVVFSRYAELDGIYLDIRVRWQERRRILKLEFDRDGLSFDQIEMQGAVGSISRRADGTEQPMHRWVRIPGERVGVRPVADPSSKNVNAAMAENDSGFVVIQDGSFGCDARDNRFRITLVRSSVYAYDKKTALYPNDPERYTDTGEHHFVMRLLNDNGQDEALLNRTVDEFVERILVIRETP